VSRLAECPRTDEAARSFSFSASRSLFVGKSRSRFGDSRRRGDERRGGDRER
jgi:hypothetical protein